MRLLIAAEQRVTEPIQMNRAGLDQRQEGHGPPDLVVGSIAMAAVTRQLGDGEQVQLQDRQGRWHLLTPIWTKVTKLTPLGDGQGIAVISSDGEVVQIGCDDSGNSALPVNDPHCGPQRRSNWSCWPSRMLFGHLSSTNGDLLLQTGGCCQKANGSS